MSLLQIAEPGQTAKPHQTKCVIGIDLGTTNSLVAATRHGITDVLPDIDGRVMLPSVVAINAQGDRKIGDAALAADDSYVKIASAKRLLGYRLDELTEQGLSAGYTLSTKQGLAAINTPDGNSITPIEVAADILAVLKQRAQDTFGQAIDGAVITVPAYFDESRRKATKDAATLAGLPVLRLINEPTAAALAYGLDNAANGTVLVYDLGGGTFDVSVLLLTEGVFEVKATAGDIQLGGDDFDQAIIDWLPSPWQQTFNPGELRRVAKAAKEALATAEQTEVILGEHRLTLTRSVFNTLIDELLQRSLACTDKALHDAGFSPAEIDHVVLVGGSTRVVAVQEALKQRFQRQVLNSVDPDKVVAIGAGIAAENLSGNQSNDSLLLDVTPLSLGVETAGELVEVLIPRNTPIPISKAQDFTTYKNGQTAMRIHVVQGERDNVNECRSLAHFSLQGIPPMNAGAARIRIQFDMDADGLLTVSAREQTTGVSTAIEVTPSYGLSEAQITDMLLASMSHAEDDVDFRRLNEQKVEAERVLDAIRHAIAEDGDLLSEDEATGIVAAIQQLERHLAGSNAEAIKIAITDLEKAADSFIEKRMNAAVMKVMQGQDINQFESN